LRCEETEGFSLLFGAKGGEIARKLTKLMIKNATVFFTLIQKYYLIFFMAIYYFVEKIKKIMP